jgi:hypothetical protein
VDFGYGPSATPIAWLLIQTRKWAKIVSAKIADTYILQDSLGVRHAILRV